MTLVKVTLNINLRTLLSNENMLNDTINKIIGQFPDSFIFKKNNDYYIAFYYNGIVELEVDRTTAMLNFSLYHELTHIHSLVYLIMNMISKATDINLKKVREAVDISIEILTTKTIYIPP
jgi:Zn-dependent peptidase ImmA (M78 family)